MLDTFMFAFIAWELVGFTATWRIGLDAKQSHAGGLRLRGFAWVWARRASGSRSSLG